MKSPFSSNVSECLLLMLLTSPWYAHATCEEDLEQPRGPVVVWCNPNAAYYEPWRSALAIRIIWFPVDVPSQSIECHGKTWETCGKLVGNLWEHLENLLGHYEKWPNSKHTWMVWKLIPISWIVKICQKKLVIFINSPIFLAPWRQGVTWIFPSPGNHGIRIPLVGLLPQPGRHWRGKSEVHLPWAIPLGYHGETAMEGVFRMLFQCDKTIQNLVSTGGVQRRSGYTLMFLWPNF